MPHILTAKPCNLNITPAQPQGVGVLNVLTCPPKIYSTYYFPNSKHSIVGHLDPVVPASSLRHNVWQRSGQVARSICLPRVPNSPLIYAIYLKLYEGSVLVPVKVQNASFVGLSGCLCWNTVWVNFGLCGLLSMLGLPRDRYVWTRGALYEFSTVPTIFPNKEPMGKGDGSSYGVQGLGFGLVLDGAMELGRKGLVATKKGHTGRSRSRPVHRKCPTLLGRSVGPCQYIVYISIYTHSHPLRATLKIISPVLTYLLSPSDPPKNLSLCHPQHSPDHQLLIGLKAPNPNLKNLP